MATFESGRVTSAESGMVEHTTPTEVLEHRNQVVSSLEPMVGKMIDSGRYLLRPEKLWKPGKFTPRDAETRNKIERESENLPLGTLVVIGGNTITEEALPTYQTAINRVRSIRDTTGSDQSGWSRWTRGWTAEEARHGDVLSDYLEKVPSFDLDRMRDATYSLIREGFNPQTGEDPYEVLIYTTMQELATQISHNNAGHQAQKHAAPILAEICKNVGADEGRHFRFYGTVAGEVAKLDPEGFIDAFYEMAHQKKMGMPGHFMEGFHTFAEVGQLSGMYTAGGYVDIVSQLCKMWQLDRMESLSERAERQRSKLLTYQRKDIDKINRHINNSLLAQWEGKQVVVPWVKQPVTLADIDLAN